MQIHPANHRRRSPFLTGAGFTLVTGAGFTLVAMRKLFYISMLALTLAAVWGAGPVFADSDIHRCVGEDGVPIFTDRSCDELGARERTAPFDKPETLARPSPARDCAREIETLQTQLRAALEARDINHLSGLYHWQDATSHTAERVLPRLEVIARRRLVEIELESVEIDGVDHPARLWLDQYDPERPGETVYTSFNLIMNSGCWWLHG